MMLPRKYKEFKEKYAWAIEFEQKFFDITDQKDKPDFYKRLLNDNGHITRTDVRIAWYLKKNPEQLGSTSYEIGNKVGVDHVSLIKFAKRLNYRGFLDFRRRNKLS